MFTELTPQQTKALNFENSISIKANAGSGKTLVLAKRYLRIALKGNIPLQRIAAITFTDKAAGELYKRVAEEIESAIHSSDEAEEVRKLNKIRRQLVSANISTIHSFCINILKEFPVESELDANFTPIDQNRSNELIELSIEETINRKLEDPGNEECRYLIRLFGSRGNLVKQIRHLINHRKIVLGLSEDFYAKEPGKIANHFRNLFLEYFQKIFSQKTEIIVSALQKINDIVLHTDPENEFAILVRKFLIGLNEIDNVSDEIFTFQKIGNLILTKSDSIKNRDYLTTKLREGLEYELGIVELFYNDIKNLSFTDTSDATELQLALTGKHLVNLFDDVIFIYDGKKHEKGYLDYEDILLKTIELLNKNAAFIMLSKKYDYMMIDEFQDTNEIQYNIFMPLLDYLKQGNLFVVGDAKQSIYRFREAELEIFEKTSTEISNKSGEEFLITLPDSFRMEQVICLFANVLFRKLFDKPDKLFNEVEHSDLVCAKPEGSGGEVAILISNEESGISEAELVSRKILSLINKKNTELSWKDIAVLVRKRSSFKELEKEFIQNNIPYRIIGGRGFFQRQSIYDIYNYFSFLLDTNNDAALAGILRSPFFSLSDLKLFEISLNFGNSFWEKLQNSNAEDSELMDIVNLLEDNLSKSRERDFNTTLRAIFENTNFISVLASRPDGDQELANLDKLQSMTNTFTGQGFKTLYDYVDFLKNAINKIEDEAQAGLAGQAEAVNLLTVHQAKGLEFPAVFLYKCHEAAREDNVRSKSVSIDKIFGILTRVPEGDNYLSEYKSAPVAGIRDYIERRKNLAEEKRLFYVGVTRAKQYLYLSAASKKNKFPSTSFMGLIIDNLDMDLTKSSHSINGELKCLVKENKKYLNRQKKIQYELSILNKIDLPEISKSRLTKPNVKEKFILDEITDISKGDIISATKVATFMQCPLKYNLIYKYGYSPLHFEFKKNKNEDYINSEFDIAREENAATKNGEFSLTTFANIKGQIIHKILQHEVEIARLKQFILNESDSYNISFFNNAEVKNSFVNDTMDLISSFYNSEEYAELKTFNTYKNEAEIYIKEKNYFLYGIIDKLIYNGKNITVVDYKTDDIPIESLKNRANYYLNQLNFYVNIVSKLHHDFRKIQVKIIFLKHPDDVFYVEYDHRDVKKIEMEISSVIANLLNGGNEKILSHCNSCYFAVNNRCII